MTAVFIPTLNRAQKLPQVVRNLRASTIYAEVYFVLESTDKDSIDTCRLNGFKYILNEGKPCYADAINTAYSKTTEEYFFTGADDLNFHAGWLENALAKMNDTIKVVGTNDMGKIEIGEARDATHYLIARDYIEGQGGVVGESKTVLFPYTHNYTDKEFIETAKARKVYEYAPNSKVEHMHPVWGKGDWDPVYQRGRDTDPQDRELYLSRQHLWQKEYL